MPRPKTPDEQKQLQHALDKFKVSASYFNAQRQREVSDLKFIDFDEQWEPQVKTQRGGGQSVDGLPQTPPRPTITINQLLAPVAQVSSQRRAARLALAFAAKGGNANDETAEAYEDIARAIQTESGATQARNWASDRSEKAGLGWYRIDTEYALDNPEADDVSWNDQNIVYRRILNQASVYPDKNAQEADFSDGKCLFITQDLAFEEYKALYKDSDLASSDESELTAVGDERPDWVFSTSGSAPDETVGKTIRIAEYWEVIEQRRKRVGLSTGGSAYEDELPEGAEVDKQLPPRYVTTRKVMWSKINAIEYLEGPQEWNGAHIPVIPTIWKEANVAGERRWTGLVGPGKEAAVSYNVLRSAVHETVALATKAPYIGYWKTIEKFQQWWKQSATRNWFMLPLDEAYDKTGNLLPPPKRNVEEPAIQALMAAAQAAKDDIHTTTGIPPAALGDLDPTNRSGAAIKALQSQAETGASGGLDNLVSITLPYEGKVLRDLIPRIYDRPKRILPAVADDETRRMVMINWPYVEGEDGKPVAIDGWQEGMPIPQGAKYLDLRKGEYAVQAVAAKSFPTRKKEAADAIANLMGSIPSEMAAALAPAMIEDLDTPGARRLASIAKQALPPQLQQAYNDGKPTPDQVEAENAALKGQLEHTVAIAKDLQQKLEGKILENQTKERIALHKDATDLRKAEISAAATMTTAQWKVDAENTRSFVEAFETKLAHDMEFRLHFAKVAAEAMSKQHEHSHELGMAKEEHAHQLQAAVQAAEHAKDQMVTQAALEPVDSGDNSSQNGGAA